MRGRVDLGRIVWLAFYDTVSVSSRNDSDLFRRLTILSSSSCPRLSAVGSFYPRPFTLNVLFALLVLPCSHSSIGPRFLRATASFIVVVRVVFNCSIS